MVEVKWTIQAVDDLESISNYILKDSTYFSKLIISDIMETIEQLALFPESGRIVPELNIMEIREIIFGNYRIIYRCRKDVVEILTVYHSSRKLGPESIK